MDEENFSVIETREGLRENARCIPLKAYRDQEVDEEHLSKMLYCISQKYFPLRKSGKIKSGALDYSCLTYIYDITSMLGLPFPKTNINFDRFDFTGKLFSASAQSKRHGLSQEEKERLVSECEEEISDLDKVLKVENIDIDTLLGHLTDKYSDSNDGLKLFAKALSLDHEKVFDCLEEKKCDLKLSSAFLEKMMKDGVPSEISKLFEPFCKKHKGQSRNKSY